MGTKSPSCPPSAAAETIRITSEPLSLAEAYASVADTKSGAVVTFSGNVRDSEKGEDIQSIRYEAYEAMALKELRQLEEEARRRWDVRSVIHHRIGEVPIGESSLVIVCAGKHRPETFEACRYILEEIKAHVPLWKVEFEKERKG